MNIPKTIRRLIKFMEATEGEVQDLFASLPNASRLPYDTGKDIIYVPGTRENKVLLVAHYDTVFDDKPKSRKVQVSGTQLYSGKKGVGIGADNRAGCCLLWMMRTLGHSLLLLPDEEIGCLGSSYMASEHADLLTGHQFMLQFDRRGAYDLVFYGTDTPDFVNYMRSKYPGYSKASGSFTDIVELMPAALCAGCNVSVSFHKEHTDREWMDVCDFIRTAYNTLNLLKEHDLPSFIPNLNYDKSRGWPRQTYSYNSYRTPWPWEDQVNEQTKQKKATKQKTKRIKKKDVVAVIHDNPPDLSEYFDILDEVKDLEENNIIQVFDRFDIDEFYCPDCGFEYTPDNAPDYLLVDNGQCMCGGCYASFDIAEGVATNRKFRKNIQTDIVTT